MKPSEACRHSCLQSLLATMLSLDQDKIFSKCPRDPMRPGMCLSVRLLWHCPWALWPPTRLTFLQALVLSILPTTLTWTFIVFLLLCLLQSCPSPNSGWLLIPQRNWLWPSTLGPHSTAHCFAWQLRRYICWCNYSILFLTNLEAQPDFWHLT